MTGCSTASPCTSRPYGTPDATCGPVAPRRLAEAVCPAIRPAVQAGRRGPSPHRAASIDPRSGGGYYGYKVHAAVCVTTGLPLAWRVETAKDSEISQVPVLVDIMHARNFISGVLVLDRGYDSEKVYETVEGYGGARV